MQRILITLALLAASPLALPAQDSTKTKTGGSFNTGFQQLDNSTNSSKFNEYRDLRDGAYLYNGKLSTWNRNGLFLDLFGTNVSRKDQRLDAAMGSAGRWRLDAIWNEIPHLYSNQAVTPYITRSPGVLGVPATMVIPFKKLNTVAADAPNVLKSDTVIANYARQYSKPMDLGTQTNTGVFGFKYGGLKAFEAGLDYTLRTKTGSRLSYGPIGDRPPRTLNIELAEPIDYRTHDFRFFAGYNARKVQVQAEYLVSDFNNEIDVLAWENAFATPNGKTFEAWDRLVGAYGRRPLAADNKYTRGTITAGLSLPLRSRLTASFSFGSMDQDTDLVPYAYQNDTIAVKTLPRATAQAKINTTSFSGDYSITPVKGLNLRAFLRGNQMTNDTPADEWTYVTQDATNLNGTVSFKNKRVSLPTAYDQTRYGIDGTLRLGFLNGSLGLGYEVDDISRDYREADTKEDILKANLRARASDWLAFRVRYLHGNRDGTEYDWAVTRQSYWYAPADAGTDNDNPQFTFSNHPDMRRYDVSDRVRDRLDLTATVTPVDALSLSATFGWRNDDYDSDVAQIKPLAGRSLADSAALTPGDQLGLLESKNQSLTFDVSWSPSERLDLNLYLGWDLGSSLQRGLEYNENNKQNPSAVNTAELGPWTRATSEWTADFDDKNTFTGASAAYSFKNGAAISASYAASMSTVEITYAGFGVTNWDGTPFAPNHQFAFPAEPPDVENTSQVLDLKVDYPITSKIGVTVGYLLDYYKVTDYQQGASSSMFEPVLTDLLLRDTSRSHQWGNRLFNAGRYLAPDYTTHLGYASFTYRF
jgi:MtrB/PioB family decaheme-associated outer membrane protein